MKGKFILLSGFIFSLLYAQSEVSEEEELFHYENYRKNSEPVYGINKIKKMISASDTISLLGFNKLSFKERFTYVMRYPEKKSDLFSENRLTEKEQSRVISAYLPEVFNGGIWSDRQQDFLINNRKLVIDLIKEGSLKNKFIGTNYKKALETVNAVEIIPFLLDMYKLKKDKDILTLLLLLVQKNNYYPFIRSNLYRDLYLEGNKDTFIEYTPVVKDYILKTSKNFHMSQKK